MVSKNTFVVSVMCYVFFFLGLRGYSQHNNSGKYFTNLLPYPQEIKIDGDISLNPKEIKSIYLYSESSDEDRFAASILQKNIESLLGIKVKINVLHDYEHIIEPAIILGIPSDDKEFLNFCLRNEMALPEEYIFVKELAEQTYILNIDRGRIVVSAGGKAGLFYGVETLNQLLEDAAWNNNNLLGCTIKDWPALAKRWIHLDVKHHLDRYEYLKEVIVRSAQHKINGIVFEFEDKFGYKSHPKIAGPYHFTPEQIKALAEYARQYHVEMIPLVQGLGHASYILKHPEYKNLSEDTSAMWAFNPLKHESYDLMFDLYKEAIEATPGSQYFHIGGDEIRFSNKNIEMKDYEEKNGIGSLNLLWINRVDSFMRAHGRTVIMWDDMPLKMAGLWEYVGARSYDKIRSISDREFDSVWSKGITKLDEIIGKFPKGAVYNHWNYGFSSKGNALLVDWSRERNLTQLGGTAIQNRRPLIPEFTRSQYPAVKPHNIKSVIELYASNNTFGELCTAWDDSGTHFETFWVGFLASANYAWNYNSQETIPQYWRKFIYRFFGPDTKDLYQTFLNLSERVEFYYSNIMKKGDKRSYRSSEKYRQLIELPSIDALPPKGELWSSYYTDLMEKAFKEKQKNSEAIEVLKRNLHLVKRNKYNLEVFISIAQFMEADANLVYSIGKLAEYADQARQAKEKKQNKTVADCLNKMADVAESAWQDLEKNYLNLNKVWEISRFPVGGEGFIPYKYGQFASRRSDLSFLIMAEEGLELPNYAGKLRKQSKEYK